MDTNNSAGSSSSSTCQRLVYAAVRCRFSIIPLSGHKDCWMKTLISLSHTGTRMHTHTHTLPISRSGQMCRFHLTGSQFLRNLLPIAWNRQLFKALTHIWQMTANSAKWAVICQLLGISETIAYYYYANSAITRIHRSICISLRNILHKKFGSILMCFSGIIRMWILMW